MHITSKIASLTKQWRVANTEVPCAIYESNEAALADRVVTLTHGKGEKAGRDRWNAVAKARHSRDMANASEPALDLLEKYLKHGKNLTPIQTERWGGDFPLTVLEEAIKRIAPRVGCATSRALADKYPKLATHRDALENLIRDVGLENLDFQAIRGSVDFAESRYGIPPLQPAKAGSGSTGTSSASGATGGKANAAAASSSATSSSGKKTAAVSLNDPRAIARALKQFSPKGNHRAKLVTLLEETRRLRLDKHPHAFCFLLRSMFEISAKAYCADHTKHGGPSATHANGEDRKLVDVLRDITKHLTKNNTDKQMQRALHGAIANLAAPESILSVTSMNQLVHNPKFSIDETHICTLFGNIFPLLEEMSR